MTRLVLVLGCHRSGTSAVAGALPALGVSLGDRSDWGGPDNLNFREDKDFLALNDAVLRATASRWDTLEVRGLNKTALLLRGPAQALLADRLQRFPVFGLKDPRMCRLLPFWRPIFEGMALDVSVVYVVRNPLAVAASLIKRNGFSPTKSLYLWLSHVVASFVDASPAWKRVAVDYDSFVADPVAEAQRASDALSLPWQPGGVLWLPEAHLRHHVADPKAIAPAIVWRAWRAACGMLGEGVAYPYTADMLAIEHEISTNLAPLFREIDGLVPA